VSKADDPRKRAYGTAVQRLHDKHRSELETYVSEEYAKVGLTYRRRLSKDERAELEHQEKVAKARETVRALVAEHGVDAVLEDLVEADSLGRLVLAEPLEPMLPTE